MLNTALPGQPDRARLPDGARRLRHAARADRCQPGAQGGEEPGLHRGRHAARGQAGLAGGAQVLPRGRYRRAPAVGGGVRRPGHVHPSGEVVVGHPAVQRADGGVQWAARVAGRAAGGAHRGGDARRHPHAPAQDGGRARPGERARERKESAVQRSEPAALPTNSCRVVRVHNQ